MQVPACWTECLDLDSTLKVLTSLALAHLDEVGAQGDQLRTAILSGDWKQVLEIDIGVNEYGWDTLQLYHMRQAQSLFSKLEPIDIGICKQKIAYETFLDSERACSETNEYLRSCVTGSITPVPYVVRLLEAARRKIKHVLGACPRVSTLRLHFGPGATTATRKKQSCPQQKFAAGLSCSGALVSSGLLPSLLRELPSWLEHFEHSWSIDEEGFISSLVDVRVDHGKLTFVPKSAKTFRSIVVEPVLNGILQQGIRHAMEARLSKAGLSTDDRTVNQRLARAGSITNELATIDLSSASDRISYQLVKQLIPADWFRLLAAARTGTAEYEGELLTLSKFSSMGNATTFPLETLIFWSLTAAAMDLAEITYDKRSFAVYGDDIIVPSAAYDHVLNALNYAGFKVNTMKSFACGPFRESCGGDYYKGIDVRPVYQKTLVNGLSLFKIHNFYVRSYQPRMAEQVLSLIPEGLRIFGPDGYGDGHLLSESWAPIRRRGWRERGYSGVAFETFVKKPKQLISVYPGDNVSPVYAVYVADRSPEHPLVPIPNVVLETRKAKDHRPYWPVPDTDGYKRVVVYTLTA